MIFCNETYYDTVASQILNMLQMQPSEAMIDDQKVRWQQSSWQFLGMICKCL